MTFNRAKVDEAADTGRDPQLTAVREAARTAKLANLRLFTAALTMSPELWGLAISQVEQQGWLMAAWAVDQGIGYPVFRLA